MSTQNQQKNQQERALALSVCLNTEGTNINGILMEQRPALSTTGTTYYSGNTGE